MAQKVILFGDSITQFWKNFDPKFFEQYNLINCGVSGQTTSQMLARFENEVLKTQPNKVVILSGINDIAENNGPISIEDILQNIIIMATKALQANIEVILCSVLPANRFYWNLKIKPSDKVIELNILLKNYAKLNSLKFIDYFTAMVDDNNGLHSHYGADGVHPNLEGYIKMKSILEPYLKS
jgi:lysophospholipase L1-like esterase